MPLPVLLDALECKKNYYASFWYQPQNISYIRTFTLLDDQCFQEKMEQFQSLFTVHQFNKMYTGTFTFMPAHIKWLYDPLRSPLHNCPAHHQFKY